MSLPACRYGTLTTLLLLLLLPALSGQQLPDYHILRGSTYFLPPENLESLARAGSVDQAEEINERIYRLLQFYRLPDTEMKARLQAAGINLLTYIPNHTYTASLPAGFSVSELQELGVRSVLPLTAAWKLSPRLEFEDYGDWAVNRQEIELLLTWHRDLSTSRVRAFCRVDQLEVCAANPQTNVFRVRIPISRIREVAALPYVAYLDQIPEPGEPEDYRGRALHRTNTIETSFSGGRTYTGAGISVQTRDDGGVGPHIDFQGRLINIPFSPGGTHGDGVSGILAGAGNRNPYMRGTAPGATLYATQYTSDFLDTTLSLHLDEQVLVTNSSYSNGCNAGYNTSAQIVDQQVYLNPTYMHVFSAGNANGADCGYGAGSQWGNVTGGHKQGTNVIATANLEQDISLRFSSSRGPAYDGRIKPDIAANGHAHQSTNPDHSYISFSGTSGAAPGIAGTLAQLHQAYQSLHNGETAPSALLKATLLNTANDLGNPGPDYLHGFGQVNALRAVRLLEEERHLSGIVEQGQLQSFGIEIPADVREARIMVYWHDFPAEPEAAHALVNDLDARLIDPQGFYQLPLRLDTIANPAQLSLPAVPGEDHLNNVEQIVLSNPEAGLYELEVTGYAVPMGPVEYFVTIEFRTEAVEMIYPFGGEGFDPGDTIRLHWDAHGNFDPFDLAYTLDDGANWVPIVNGLAGNARIYDWPVPDLVTSKARLRVTRNGLSDESDANFSILPTPQDLEITQACPAYIRLEWSEVFEASHYEVYQLGNQYMDSVDITTDLFYDFPTTDLDPGLEYWFSVRAVFPAEEIFSERAIAVPHNSGLLECTQMVDLTIAGIDQPVNSEFTVCENDPIFITISGSNDGMTSQVNPEVGYNFNGQVFTESLPLELAPGDTYIHTFSNPASVSNSGTFELTTWIHTADDTAVFNDTTHQTLQLTYYPGLGESLAISEDFETPPLPDYWFLVNEDMSYGWEPIHVPGVNGDTTRCLWMDNYSYTNPDDSRDKIVTVPIDLTDADLINPVLIFDIAYAPYPGETYVDTLQVDVYTDCSKTYAGTVYKKWEDELGTSQSTFAEYYPEGSGDWRTEIVDLSDFIGQSIVLEFVNISGWSNSLFIDNINIQEFPPPVAMFPLLADTICIGDEWLLESTSTGEDLTLDWDFGPGAEPSAASGAGPHAVQFNQIGPVTITLTAENWLGSDIFSQTVLVLPPPEPAFDLAILDVFEFQFFDLSVNADTRIWDFGDGSPSSTEANPVHTFTDVGFYDVTLTAVNECDSVAITSPVEVIIINTEETLSSHGLHVWPNPGSGLYYLELPNHSAAESQIRVYDTTGRLLREVTMPAGEAIPRIDISNQPAGLYLFEYRSGDRQYTKRLIKQ